MTPKEKAEQLVSKYRHKIVSFLSDNMKDMNAKECALIAVDEIINESSQKIHRQGRSLLSDKEYWLQVKQEIEKL